MACRTSRTPAHVWILLHNFRVWLDPLLRGFRRSFLTLTLAHFLLLSRRVQGIMRGTNDSTLLRVLPGRLCFGGAVESGCLRNRNASAVNAHVPWPHSMRPCRNLRLARLRKEPGLFVIKTTLLI